MKWIYCILLIFSLHLATHAQSDSSSHGNNILLVTYELKMYRSTIDPALMQKSGLSYEALRKEIQKGLDNTMLLELKAKGEAKSVLQNDTNYYNGELAHIHKNISYSYELMPGAEKVETAEEEKGMKKIGGKLNKLVGKNKATSEYEEKMGTWVEDGQVVSRIDNREKYMKTKIFSNKIIKDLCSKHQAKTIVFINQLDILQADKEFSGQRKVKIHYTIFDHNGREIASGAEVSYFETTQNDPKKIVYEELYKPCHAIAAKL